MTDPITLLSSQSKKEVKRNPVMGLFEDTFEYIAGTPVKEGSLQRVDLEQAGQWKEHIPGRVEGSLTGFNKPRTPETLNPQIRVEQLKRELTAAHNYEVTHLPVEEKRVKTNELLGFNKNYRVPVDESGNYSGIYYEIEVESKNSELSKAELKANREKQVAQARGKAQAGFQMRQGELDMGKERVGGGHFSTAPG